MAFNNFGNRIKTWITFNEPSMVCDLGYNYGVHAPGLVRVTWSAAHARPARGLLHPKMRVPLRAPGGVPCSVPVHRCWQLCMAAPPALCGPRGQCVQNSHWPPALCACAAADSRRARTPQAWGNWGKYICGHNLLLAHAAAYRLYKSKYATVQVGPPGGVIRNLNECVSRSCTSQTTARPQATMC
jgi:hypothetical protein